MITGKRVFFAFFCLFALTEACLIVGGWGHQWHVGAASQVVEGSNYLNGPEGFWALPGQDRWPESVPHWHAADSVTA